MIGTGLLLAIPFPSGIHLDYVKLGVKLAIALGIGAIFGVIITQAVADERGANLIELSMPLLSSQINTD